jgi:hypothetical protein
MPFCPLTRFSAAAVIERPGDAVRIAVQKAGSMENGGALLKEVPRVSYVIVG